MPTPVPGMVEGTEVKWGGWTPRAGPPRILCSGHLCPGPAPFLAPTSKGAWKGRAGPLGGAKLSAGIGICAHGRQEPWGLRSGQSGCAEGSSGGSVGEGARNKAAGQGSLPGGWQRSPGPFRAARFSLCSLTVYPERPLMQAGTGNTTGAAASPGVSPARAGQRAGLPGSWPFCCSLNFH